MQSANIPHSPLLEVELPEVRSPPCLRHLTQNTMKYLIELPVSLHCLEWKPLHCQKSQMPTFQGGWDTSGLQNQHYAEKSPCVMIPQMLQLWSWVILKAGWIQLSFMNQYIKAEFLGLRVGVSKEAFLNWKKIWLINFWVFLLLLHWGFLLSSKKVFEVLSMPSLY